MPLTGDPGKYLKITPEGYLGVASESRGPEKGGLCGARGDQCARMCSIDRCRCKAGLRKSTARRSEAGHCADELKDLVLGRTRGCASHSAKTFAVARIRNGTPTRV
jgi:hypothetical protein